MVSTRTLLQSSMVARFQDCDPFGHLNSARYIEYFLDARQDQIQEHYGIELLDEKRATSWFVRQFQIAYYRPIAVMERFIIRTRLIGADSRTLLVEGAFLSEGSDKLKALAWASFTHVNPATGKSVDHPQELMELFGRIVESEPLREKGFESRTQDKKGIMRDLG